MAEWIDFKEIKERVGMEDLLGYYNLWNKLKKKGRKVSGCCPIHKGRGLSVDLEMNAWHCFGCKAKGNILDFVMEMEKVEIREAGLLIAQWFGLLASQNGSQIQKNGYFLGQRDKKVSEYLKDQRGVQNGSEKLTDVEIESAVEVNIPLTFQLKNLKSNHPYFKKRGLRKETIEEFGLGYCERGLMKGRIAIPIHNEKGELVAYAGRVVENKEINPENPKYKFPVNFKKSLVVFNLHRVIEKSHLILVEGFFDCFKVWQVGFRNVVALMGSEMSEEQEKLIVQAVGSSGKVLLFFDGDETGRDSSKDVIERLVNKVYVKVIALEKGQEPDSLPDSLLKEKLKIS